MTMICKTQSYIQAVEQDIVDRERRDRNIDRYRTKVWNLINKLESMPTSAHFKSYIQEIIEADEELH